MTNGHHTWDLFIAHAGPDGPLAKQLYASLHTKLRVFLDSEYLKLGDDWDSALASAQRAALVTVVLVSSRTEKAYYQREEIAAAIAMAREDAEQHRVVPIYLETGAEAAAIPYGLRLKHGLTLSDQVTLADAAERLIELVRGLGAVSGETADPASATLSKHPGMLHAPPPGWTSPVRESKWRYKLVALDLDGTLLRGKNFVFSWELVWGELKVSKNVQKELRRQYRIRSEGAAPDVRVAAYRRWCEEAVAHFRQRGLTRDRLAEMARTLQLTRNCREALTRLREAGVVTAIISGGIDTLLEDCFSDFRDHVDFVFINRLRFDAGGVIEGVVATAYDFQGKADALSLVCKQVGCSLPETVFVGDRFNDETIMLQADLAIAYPPLDKLTSDAARVSIQEDDLTLILPHVFVE